LQGRRCRGGWNKNKEKKLIFFHENSDFFFRVEVGKKGKNKNNKILFLFQITTFECWRVR
jgi:hypothetical protein